MKKLALGMAGLLVVGVTAQPAAPPGSLIGMRVPPYPQGMKDVSGACSDANCRRAFGVIEEGDVPRRVLALQFIERKPDGKPVWLVTDEVAYPRTERGEFVADCGVAGTAWPDTYAVIGAAENGDALPRRWAIRLDPASGRFQKPDLAKFRCSAHVGED